MRVPLGFLFAVLYVWLAGPTIRSIVVGAVFVVLGLALRGWASGCLRKNEQLTTSGPYAYTRNPLYLGSLILALGFVIAGRSWWIAGAAGTFFVLIYLPVIHAEEKFLRQQFPEFEDYAREVPRLLPRIVQRKVDSGGRVARGHTSSNGFSWDLYRRHREYNALLGSIAMLAVLAFKLMDLL
jgi:protein-S-isoprenylcysteine O-methyltransferase Ste14